MTPQERLVLRITLLQIARSAPVGVTREFAPVALRLRGVRPSTAEIDDEIAYLCDKGMLAAVEKKLSPEVKAWRITASGRDYLAEEGYE